MLIKRPHLKNAKAVNVKKAAICLFSVLAVSTPTMTPAAIASDSPLIEKTIKVSFKLSDLEATDGVKEVYAKFEKRARAFCKADRATLSYLSQSVSDCTYDLVAQFIDNASIDALEDYHLEKTATMKTEKFALN